jgi:hypothetical protein
MPRFLLLFSFILFPFFHASPGGFSGTVFKIKVFLQGPFNDDSMSDELNRENLLPLSQPYNRPPWEYKGKEQISRIPKGVVDWILVGLTKGNSISNIIEMKAGFLKCDGIITSLDGKSPLVFEKAEPGCYIIIEHRNHLPVMSREPVSLSDTVYYDFTSSSSKGLGNSLTELDKHIFGMISGDGDSNGEINNLDFKTIADNLLKTGYLNADLDMNGVVNILDYKKTNINLSRRSSIPIIKNY